VGDRLSAVPPKGGDGDSVSRCGCGGEEASCQRAQAHYFSAFVAGWRLEVKFASLAFRFPLEPRVSALTFSASEKVKGTECQAR
jgi:hypothetical protein